MHKKCLTLALWLCLATRLAAQLPPPCPSNATPPADLCEDACIYCNFNGYSGSTAGYTGQAPPDFCDGIQNEQWLGFIAGAPAVTFIITPRFCANGNGVQTALYETCTSAPLACDPGCWGCGMVPQSISAGLVIGQTYLLLIDGWLNDQCTFDITVDPPGAVIAPPVGPVGAIQGPSTACAGGVDLVYSVDPIVGAAAYTWSAPPGSLINGQNPPVTLLSQESGYQVTVTLGSAGGQVCVQGLNACYTGPMACKNITIQPISPTIFPPVLVCAENAPHTTPWGETVATSGFYQTTLTSAQGCDSLLSQQVTVKPPLLTTLPQQTICGGEHITVCGMDISQPGPFSILCKSYQGCDSLVSGALAVFSPVAEIIASGAITCYTPTVTLLSTPSPGVKIWKNLAGQMLGSGPILTTATGGTIILQVTAQSGSLSCVVADTIEIPADNAPPGAAASGGVLGCFSPSITLNGYSAEPNVQFAWSGPGGFVSSLEDPLASAPGNYVLTVTNLFNGCASTATAIVESNLTPPSAAATGSTLTCSATSASLAAASNVPAATFAWSGPGGFLANAPTATVSAPGAYIVTVTNPANGCTSIATAAVAQDTAPPSIAISNGSISCATPVVALNGSSSASGATFAWSGPSGFSANLPNATASAAGDYVLLVRGANGCTATATATVLGDTLAPGASANGGTISCAAPTLALFGGTSASGATFAWSGPSGFASFLQNPVAAAPGTYVLRVTGANQCTSSATAIVAGDFAVPSASAIGGTITCQSASASVSGSSATPGATFAWSGPGGFASLLQNPVVTSAGTYALTVSAPNGCTATTTAAVSPDANVPNVSVAAAGALTCLASQVQLAGSSATPGTMLAWSGPGGFASGLPNPVVAAPGTYTLLVTNPATGCSAMAAAVVEEDKMPPTLTVVGGTLACGSLGFDLSASVATPVAAFTWSGPGGFVSALQNPLAPAPGDYILTTTGANGCTATAVATVAGDPNIPVVQAVGGTLTCAVAALPLSGSADLGGTFAWNGPGGFVSVLQNPVVSQPGDYVLTVTHAASGCTATALAKVEQDIAAPDASASGGTIDCNASAVALSGSSPTAGAALAWSGPSGFVSVLQNPVVGQPGTYMLTATGPNGCTSTRLAEVFLDTQPPNVAASALDILTCAAPTIGLDGTASAPTSPLQSVRWAGPNGYVSALEDPNDVVASGTYVFTATSANGCSSIALVTVTADTAAPDAVAFASVGTIDCRQPTAVLWGNSATPGAYYAWSGPGNFSANTANVPNVGAPGTYTLRVTNPTNGCTAARSVSISADFAAPGVLAAADTITCKALSASLFSSSAAFGATFVWSGPGGFWADLPSAATTVPGAYTVVATGPNGCTSAATVEVKADLEAPVASAAADGVLTCKDTLVCLDGQISPPGAMGHWLLPDGGTTLANPLCVAVPGQYAFIATAANGCESGFVLEIEQDIAAPVVAASPTILLDCYVPQRAIPTSISAGAPICFWQKDGDTSHVFSQEASPLVSLPGVYALVVEDASNGCTATAQCLVSEDKTAPALVVSAPLITCSSPTARLDAETPGVANAAYQWHFGGSLFSTAEDPLASEPGNYALTVTNLANGCTSTQAIELLQNLEKPPLAAQGDTLTCAAPVGAIAAISPVLGVAYQWSGPGGFSSNEAHPSVSFSGNYVVTATDPTNGCTAIATATVVRDAALPVAQASGGIITCKADTVQLLGATDGAGFTWLWSGPGGFVSTLQNPAAVAPGTYALTVTNPANGCQSFAAAFVGANLAQPLVSIVQPAKWTCETKEMTLEAHVAAPGNYAYHWTAVAGSVLSGAATHSPIVGQAGEYLVVVVDLGNGCTSEKNALVQADTAAPSGAVVRSQDVSCFGDSDGAVFIEAVHGGAPPYAYAIDNQAFGLSQNFAPLAPGTHTLTIRGANGCEHHVACVVGEPAVLSVELGPDTSLHLGQALELAFDKSFVSDPSRAVEVRFNPGWVDSVLCFGCAHVLQPLHSFRYEVLVRDSNGCEARDARLVSVDKTRLVYIPNAIDLSAAGNDVFTVFGGEGTVRVQSLRVFDRWGEAVFENFDFAPGDLSAGWRGTFREKNAPPAVYVYYAEVLFLDGEIGKYAGDVAVLGH